MHETESFSDSTFATLTYSDEFLPKSGQLDKSELQRFFKRLRRRMEPDRIKYFACGEYGETYGRPHYHAILFGVSPKDKALVEKAWPFGFVKLGTVTYDSARYVADYVMKQLSGPAAVPGWQQPFQLVSKGLGKEFVLANAERLKADLGLTVRGVPCGLPKYYRKQLDIASEELYEASQVRLQGVRDHYESKYGIEPTGEVIYSKVKKSRIQSEKNHEARAHLTPKGSF